MVFFTGYGKDIPDTLRISPKLFDLEADDSEVSLEEAEMSLSIDSLIAISRRGVVIDTAMVPAARQYQYIWDTQFVNPYKFNISEQKDTFPVFMAGYCPPTRNVVTSDFGFRSGWKFHYGIDLRVRIGDSIKNSFDGMVRIAKRISSYGNYVVVRHFNGLETVYAHLSKILVHPGDLVKAGELIGLGGNTGRSTGPHLHYELRYLGQPIPPRDVVDFTTFSCLSVTLVISQKTFAYVQEINKIRFYTIRKGDTLSAISRKLGVSVTSLCRLNKMTTKTILKIGLKLRFT